MDKFTVPEINLMCILDTSSKENLLSELRLCKDNVYEPEMIELIDETIKKVEKLTDKEFSEIGFFLYAPDKMVGSGEARILPNGKIADQDYTDDLYEIYD